MRLFGHFQTLSSDDVNCVVFSKDIFFIQFCKLYAQQVQNKTFLSYFLLYFAYCVQVETKGQTFGILYWH